MGVGVIAPEYNDVPVRARSRDYTISELFQSVRNDAARKTH